MEFRARETIYDLKRRVLVMGIINVTPDSFSDGGQSYARDAAVAAGLRMLNEGADILDVGGESTRPGAEPVDASEEIDRVVPVIRTLAERSGAAISVDTWKAEVAQKAVAAGASIINDVSGFLRDPELKSVAAATDAGCVAMHMRGTPQTMQTFTEYDDVIREIDGVFGDIITMLTSAGVEESAIALDPGIGFSKTVEQNLALIRDLDAFSGHGRPILLGPSRKSFIGKTLKIDTPDERIWGTAAAIAYGIAKGARIVRVHDVPEMRQVADLAAAIAFS